MVVSLYGYTALIFPKSLNHPYHRNSTVKSSGSGFSNDTGETPPTERRVTSACRLGGRSSDSDVTDIDGRSPKEKINSGWRDNELCDGVLMFSICFLLTGSTWEGRTSASFWEAKRLFFSSASSEQIWTWTLNVAHHVDFSSKAKTKVHVGIKKTQNLNSLATMTSIYESEIRCFAEWTFEKQPSSSLQNVSDQLYFMNYQERNMVPMPDKHKTKLYFRHVWSPWLVS